MSLTGRDVLRVLDLSATELSEVLDLALRAKQDRFLLQGRASGKCAALLFEKPSLRTKSSFAVGAARLGLAPVYFSGEEVGLGTRESAADVGRILSRFFDVIVCRTFGQQRLDEMADAAHVPVVNALSDAEHPCQALADLLTLRELFGKLEGLRIAWVGDGNNVCNSLLLAATLAGVKVRVATPEAHEPDAAVLREAWTRGGEIELVSSPAEAVAEAQAVYTDTWISMGQEQEKAWRMQTFAGYRVDAALMARAAKDAVFLHCLPAHRGLEVTDDVLDSKASVVLDQAENRLHVQVALLALLLGVA